MTQAEGHVTMDGQWTWELLLETVLVTVQGLQEIFTGGDMGIGATDGCLAIMETAKVLFGLKSPL